MRSFVVLFCLLGMTGCSEKAPSAPTPIGQDVVLAPGQSTSIEQASISVRFEKVSGDSRCPGDAICMTGGDAQVQIDVIPARGDRQSYVLHTGDMRPVVHDDLTISLVDLSPYPFASRGPIKPEDYRAKLRVTR